MLNKKTIIFVTLSVVASGLNYLTYPLLGRILPSTQYIDITVALSLLTQIGTFMSALIAITIGLSKEKNDNKHEAVEKLQHLLLQIFAIMGIVFLAASPFIMPLISTPVIFALPIALWMILSVPSTVISGYYNGINELKKLGIVAVTTASLQIVAGVSTALISQSGYITMLAMASSQAILIIIVYRVFRTDKIPRLSTDVFRRVKVEPKLKKIVTYTVIASVAIMAINLLQISDLLIIKELPKANSKMYTDIYIVSRMVFFAGMILIWPFLGQVDIDNHKNNLNHFFKLMAMFGAIAVGAIAFMGLFGGLFFQTLFGRTYSWSSIWQLVTLSIIFKIAYLVITAISLFFIVIRRKLPILFSIIAGIPVIIIGLFGEHLSMLQAIFFLTVAACITAAIASYSFVSRSRKTVL